MQVSNVCSGDEARPECNRCIKAGRQCLRGYNVGFRHGHNPARDDLDFIGYGKSAERFALDQEWITVPTDRKSCQSPRKLDRTNDHKQ